MYGFVLIFVELVAVVFGEKAELSDSVDFVRVPYNVTMTRFDALFTCKVEVEGSFASSYYVTDRHKKWLYKQLLYENNPSIKYHRDLYNDSSYLNYSVWRTFDGFPLKEKEINYVYENMTINVTFSSYSEIENYDEGLFICESTPCGAGNWIYKNKNCYHLGPKYLNQAYTWSQSRNYCKSVSSDLLVLSSQKELDIIAELLDPFTIDTFVYIGYYAQDKQTWNWINNFQSNIKNFAPDLAKKPHPAHYNVSAIFKPKNGRVNHTTIRAIPDSLEIIDLLNFNTFLTFVCKKKIETCGTIPVLNYTTYKIINNFDESDYLIYECIPGYEIVKGDRIRLCNLNGKWRGHDLECAKKYCGTLAIPDDAYLLDEIFNSIEKPYSYQDTIIHACKKGYRLVQNDPIRVCNESGLWSGEPIKCERIACKELSAPANGELKLSNNNTMASYKCKPGFEFYYGTSTRYCNTVTSQWTGVDPVCKKVFQCPDNFFNFGSKCLRFMEVRSSRVTRVADVKKFCNTYNADLFVSNAIYDLKSEIYYRNQSYLLFINETIQRLDSLMCFNLRSTQDRLIECRRPFTLICAKNRTSECSDEYILELLNNNHPDRLLYDFTNPMDVVSISHKSFRVNTVVNITCKEGYRSTDLRKYDTFKCLANGTWSKPTLNCQRTYCPLSFLNIQNGKCLGKNNFGSRVICYCHYGFYMDQSSVRTTVLHFACDENGKWTISNQPKCIPVTCEKPNYNLNSPLILVTDGNFTVGNFIEFECRSGYKLVSGNLPRAQCLNNGNWSSDLPSCEKVTCSHPGLIENGQIITRGTYTLSAKFYYLEIVQYKCNVGYRVCGNVNNDISFLITCIDEETWSSDLMSCCKIECKNVDKNALNVKHSVDRYYYNDKVTYHCLEGYKHVSGEMVRTCVWDGTLSGRAPICVEFTCDNNVLFSTNADLVYLSNKLNSVAEFKCGNNTRLAFGNLKRYCTINGWSGKPAYCESLTCEAPELIENGYIVDYNAKNNKYAIDSVVTYKCKKGYVAMYGDERRYCLNSMEWSGVPPSCVEITCPYLKRPANCDLVQSGSSYNSIAEYKCHFGYKLKSSPFSPPSRQFKRRCNESGEWDLYEPVCEIIRCPRLSNRTFENGYIKYKCRNYGCEARYYCHKGHDLEVGDSVRVCTMRGRWSGEEAYCKQKELMCQLPNQTANSFYEVYSLLVGAKVMYYCQLGFEITAGDGVRVCQPNQTWSGSDPKCTPKQCPPAPVIPHAAMSVLSRPYPQYNNSFGMFISYQCRPGFSQIDGKNVRNCDENGTWSGNDIVCKERTNDLIDMNKYNKNKSMSKAFGTVAILFIVIIYLTLLIIDINWKLLFRLIVRFFRYLKSRYFLKDIKK